LAPLHQIECGITKGASTVGGLHPVGFGFGGTFGNTLTGADALLSGETDGMASDFTRSDGTGYVSVKDTATPANDKSNVIGDLFWTNSGTSPKLINTSAGALAWSPHNLLLQSQTMNTSWSVINITLSLDNTTAPDGTTTAEKFDEATASGRHILYQLSPATVLAGYAHTFSIYLKDGDRRYAVVHVAAGTGSGDFFAYFDLQTGTITDTGKDQAGAEATSSYIASTITDVGNGWYRCTVSGIVNATATTAYCQVELSDRADNSSGSFTSGSPSYLGTSKFIYAWGGQLNKRITATSYLATTTAARYGLGIDYSGGSYGLLVEPAATNLILQSQNLGTTWTNNSSTESLDATTAPDGTTTADQVVAAAANAEHDMQQNVTSLDMTSQDYTYSVYMKKSSLQYSYIQFFRNTSPFQLIYAIVDLDGGTITESGAANGGTLTSSAITALANGWYRVRITGRSGANGAVAHTFRVGLWNASTGGGGSMAFNATTADHTYFWGAQVELGTVATSPIPTFAATVTRAKDLIDSPNSIFPIGATEQSIFVWMTDLGTANGKTLVAIGDGAGASYDTGVIYKSTTGPSVKSGSYTNGVTQADFTIGNITVGTAFKVAARYKANDFHAAVGGTLSAAPDTSGTYPSGMIEARLGFPSDENPWGRYFHIVALPRAYSNAELQSETA
jgi:hypothetical protein